MSICISEHCTVPSSVSNLDVFVVLVMFMCILSNFCKSLHHTNKPRPCSHFNVMFIFREHRDCHRHSMANCHWMVRDHAVVTMDSLYTN